MMAVTIAILKKTLSEMKASSERLFRGEITISKKECWLIGTILLLAVITIGLFKAPLTHGVNITIGSHNGNHNGNNSANGNDGCGSESPAGGAADRLQERDDTKNTEKKHVGSICRKRRKGHDNS